MGKDKRVGGSRECEKCRNNYPAEFANCPECGHPQEAIVMSDYKYKLEAEENE